MSTLVIIFIILQLLFAVLIFFLTIAFITGAPFVPSDNEAVETMVRLAEIRPGKTVYDLGSGDGRLLLMAAKRGAHAVGFEINPYLVLLTKWRARRAGLSDRIRVRCTNFWSQSVENADVIFIYLIPWRMERLRRKLQHELKPGSLVISNSFIFRTWEVHHHDRKHHIYAFRIGRNGLAKNHS